jgi:hypothetical protein
MCSSLRRGDSGASFAEQRRKWYKGICNFAEVDFHPNLLVCWLAGDTAAIADELDDEEVQFKVLAGKLRSLEALICLDVQIG